MKKLSISSFTLHLIAAILMFGDHLCKTLLPNAVFLTCTGRLAFPIFAFCIAEGYTHTKDFPRYLLRLLLFAILSELPFDLAFFGTPFFFGYQNVLFTFLLSLPALWMIDRACTASDKKTPAYVIAAAGCALSASLLCTDYGAAGCLTVILFFLAARCGTQKKRRCIELLGLLAINLFLLPSDTISISSFSFPIQSLAVLSLPLIWQYRGQKGFSNGWVRYAFYFFYPVHLLVLGAAAYFK